MITERRARARGHRATRLCAAALLAAACIATPSIAAAPAPAAIGTPAPGVTSRELQLRAEPRDDATTIQRLGKGAAVRVLLREGAWYRVDAEGQQGWVRLYWVRTGGAHVAMAAARAPARNISDSLAAFRARRERNQVAATLGVRGLSEEQLAGAHFDAAQLAKLDALAVNLQDASGFAAAAPLQARSVEELGAPATSRRSRR